jgi:hypothetical protein
MPPSAFEEKRCRLARGAAAGRTLGCGTACLLAAPLSGTYPCDAPSDLDRKSVQLSPRPPVALGQREQSASLSARCGSSACLSNAEARTIPTVVTLNLPRRLAAWLCLALVMLTGFSPAQGIVVCIENDGCVSIEVKATGAECGGCREHEESDSPAKARAASSEGAAFPCIDIAVPGSPEQQLGSSRSIGVHVGPWIALPPEIRVQHATPSVSAGRGPPPCIPRAADSLEHIRTVVLLV